MKKPLIIKIQKLNFQLKKNLWIMSIILIETNSINNNKSNFDITNDIEKILNIIKAIIIAIKVLIRKIALYQQH